MSRSQLACVFDVSVRGFDESIRPLAPKNCTKKKGHEVMFYARGLLEEWWKHKADLKYGLRDPVQLAEGEQGPALERFRDERAKIAKLERKALERTLVDRGTMHECLARMASVLRRAGERLRIRCGPQALEIFNEALDSMDRSLETFFLEHGEDPGNNGEAKRKRR